MTIQEYWEENNNGEPSILYFEFAEEFTCCIRSEGATMEEYGEGEFVLEHIKTIEQYKELHKLLTGEELEIIS